MLLFKKKKSTFITPPFKFTHYFTDKEKRTSTFAILLGAIILPISYYASELLSSSIIFNVGAIGALMVIVIPFMLKGMKRKSHLDSIDSNLPIFVLSLISSIQSGNSLLRAVEEAAGREMGSLTPELENLRANISWGMPHKEAFDNFTERLGTQLSKRVGTLLGIALDMGGDVASTLQLVQHHVSEMQHLEKARKSELQPYLYTIYIAFLVFLVINVLLVVSFFAEMQVIKEKLIEEVADKEINLGMFSALIGIDVGELTGLMFNMAIIEAIFGGMAAGKISEGTFTNGLKHVVIMVVLTVGIYSVLGVL